jgi:hypothetical protein
VQFAWDAYQLPDIVRFIMEDVGDNFLMHITRSPLICFEIVEWHATDRVRNQFGLRQDPPGEPFNLGEWHNLELTGSQEANWQTRLNQWIIWWDNHRAQNLEHGELRDNNIQVLATYHQWYMNKFGRWRILEAPREPEQQWEEDEDEEEAGEEGQQEEQEQE